MLPLIEALKSSTVSKKGSSRPWQKLEAKQQRNFDAIPRYLGLKGHASRHHRGVRQSTRTKLIEACFKTTGTNSPSLEMG